MRGNITNLSMEHRDQSNIGGHVTSHTQWGYGNFSLHSRTVEHNSYDCYEGYRIGSKNGYNGTFCKRVPRNEVKNGENYVKIDESSHKRKGDAERYHDSYDHYDHSYGSKDMYIEHNDKSQPIKTGRLMRQALRNRFGVGNHEGQRQGQTKEKFMESSMSEKSTKVNETFTSSRFS
ncbi:hypothetical protein M9H77_14024 [Catharanthus roseus]|uniref:Uncharacterized protein n=1 Tax=Catharanthus roseus TaxID=4058 RepID=A0ACC0BLX5_CATRO|nr:hypothetical protein M9H77_14024 [Catharanthus roseus]